MNYIFCDVQQQQSHVKLKSPHVALVVGLLQVCSPAAQEQKQAAKSGVLSYELSTGRVGVTQIHFTKRAESALCHDSGSGVPV